jgi:hypothetical protein
MSYVMSLMYCKGTEGDRICNSRENQPIDLKSNPHWTWKGLKTMFSKQFVEALGDGKAI